MKKSTALPRDHVFSQRDNFIALLAGLSLFLSTIEYLFPKPLPAFRLGLANLPVLLSFGVLRPREILLLGFFKVLGQALINGTLASYVFLFSLGGTAASILVMTAWYYLFQARTSYMGISLAGALASNIVQAGLSLSFVFGESAWAIVPYLLAIGTATGVVMGLFALRFASGSVWFSQLVRRLGILQQGLPGGAELGSPSTLNQQDPDSETAKITPKKEPRQRRPRPFRELRRRLRAKFSAHTAANAHPLFMFWVGLALLVLFVVQSQLELRLAQTLLLFLVAFLIGKGPSLSYFASLVLGVTFFSLLQPLGRVLFTVAGLAVTESALLQGLYRGLTLVGLVLSSLIMIQPGLRIPGRAGFYLARIFAYYEAVNLRRSGLTARGLVASIDNILAGLWKPEVASVDSVGNSQRGGDPVRGATGPTTWPFVLGAGLLLAAFIFMSVIDK